MLIEEVKKEMSFDVSIPSALLLDPEIKPPALKLFCLIKSLIRNQEYSVVSNKCLQELMNRELTVIKRNIRVLKNAGYIELELGKFKDNSQRKIFLGPKSKRGKTQKQNINLQRELP